MLNFFKKIGGFFTKFWNNTPTALQKLRSAINFTSPVLNFIVQQADPKDAAEVQNIVTEIQSDSADLSALIADAHSSTTDQSTAARLSSWTGSVATNLDTLLKAGHIKDQKLQGEIQLALGEFQAVLGAFKPAQSSTAA